MPRSWQRFVAASILGLGVSAGAAFGQTLPIPGALASPVTNGMPNGVRTPAVAVSSTPPPGGVPVGEVQVSPIKDLTPANWPSEPALEVVHPEHGHGHGHVPGNLAPFASEEPGLHVSLEYLLYRPRRGAFDFAINDPSRDLVTAGNLESQNYELRSGIRAGLGYRIGETKWDALMEYTYLRSSAGRNITAAPGGALYPTVGRPGFIDEAQFSQAAASFEYNTFDAIMGRRFCIDDHLGLRMFGGFRFATIRQTETIAFDGIDARSSLIESKNAFDGFGPVLGGEAVWAGWRGFHLYARGSGGMLTGRTQNPIVETNNLGGTTYSSIDFDDRKVVPFAGVGIGGGWQYRQFSLRVGYEIINYFGLIDQPRFVDDVSRGRVVTESADLSLEGIFAQFGFSF